MAMLWRFLATGSRLKPKLPVTVPFLSTQHRDSAAVRAGQTKWLSQQRHGTAVEPIPSERLEPKVRREGGRGNSGAVTTQVAQRTDGQAAAENKGERSQGTAGGLNQLDESGKANGKPLDLLPREVANPSAASKKSVPKSAAAANTALKTASSAPSASANDGKDGNERTPEEERTRQVREEARQSGPLEAIMQAPTPEEVSKSHPSMSPSKYVHHFDSYSLVKQLEEGGYTKGQAITSMKGIRALLAQNLDVAQESLVSKSDVENETYLFRAACSELGAEIRNNRRLQDESMRQQRTHLQHEVDIVAQTLNQELATLSDNVRGMFNDRRMTVREEQKSMDSALQQITYKISTSLAGESKSEIEGVRWILIRRAVLGIIFMAFLALSTVRYTTWLSHERAKEAKRLADEEERRRLDGGKSDNSSPMDAAAILTAN